MSYAQRFMQNKTNSSPDAEGWRTVGGSRVAEHGGGRVAEPTTRRWDNEGSGRFPSAFSKQKREEDRAGPFAAAYPPPPPKPKVISLDSTEDFPTLGAKPKASNAPVQTGWASKAASWAAADAAEAAAERQRQAEQEEADKERRRQSSGIPDLLSIIHSRRNEVYRAGRTEFEEPAYDDYEGRPRSPPYDPEYEEQEYAAAAGAANPHFEGIEEDEEGWTERR